jgi:transposase
MMKSVGKPDALLKAQKCDDLDAEAIAEEVTRPTMGFVELKSEEQLDRQTLHRARDRLVGERATLSNQLRTILLERGIVIAQGRLNLERELDAMLSEEEGLAVSPRLRKLIEGMIPTRRGLPPVVICRGARPSHAARSRPLANVWPSPIAAARAVAFSTPIPGIVARR